MQTSNLLQANYIHLLGNIPYYFRLYRLTHLCSVQNTRYNKNEYLLPNSCMYLVCYKQWYSPWKMQSIKIHNCSVPGYGLCNLIGGYQVFTQDIFFLMTCVDTARILLLNIHNQVPDHSVVTQTSLSIVSTPNPVPKNMKNLCVEGNHTFRKLNYRRAVRFLQTAFNIVYLFHQFCTLCLISYLKQTEEMNYYKYKYTL
jgi:hypothetical protein